MSPLLTVDEVAAALRVEHKQVLALVREGKLPAVRVSRKVIRFSRAALEAHLGVTLPAPPEVLPAR